MWARVCVYEHEREREREREREGGERERERERERESGGGGRGGDREETGGLGVCNEEGEGSIRKGCRWRDYTRYMG